MNYLHRNPPEMSQLGTITENVGATHVHGVQSHYDNGNSLKRHLSNRHLTYANDSAQTKHPQTVLSILFDKSVLTRVSEFNSIPKETPPKINRRENRERTSEFGTECHLTVVFNFRHVPFLAALVYVPLRTESARREGCGDALNVSTNSGWALSPQVISVLTLTYIQYTHEMHRCMGLYWPRWPPPVFHYTGQLFLTQVCSFTRPNILRCSHFAKREREA